MKSGKARERRLRRLGAMSQRYADVVNRLAKRDRLPQEILSKIGPLGNAFLQPVGVLGR